MAVSVTAVSEAQGTVASRHAARTQTAVEEGTLYAVVLSSALIVIGLIWDISWHRTIGRDTFWSPPHILEQGGAIISGLSCGFLVLRTTFAGTGEDRARTVRFWRYFYGPLGAWVCIWGSLMMVASAPFDAWWHNAYGLDVKIISLPHVILASGMIAIQVGAMLMAVSAQNRAEREEVEPRMRLIFMFAASLIVLMMQTMMMERTAFANTMHSAAFYITTALTIPVFLVAFACASRASWPATRIALGYMAIAILAMWILKLFPGSPMLAPIYRQVTHMVPPPFPVLLFAPAIAIDVLLQSRRTASDWKLAAMLGVAFVGALLVVSWPWAEFMLSPYSRNFVFGGDTWDYNSRPGAWQYEFWDLDRRAGGGWSATLFAMRMGVALLVAIVMSRLGLASGRSLAKVRR